ncbi:helix-turn-helix domain-containing protein [Nocardiopsis sp. FR26]|uniref:helix-turn-helix domain-containing protein n=1 Tax=Nocardiopsis sp. FR26 TaxID=2605987 RepID=UPI00135A6B52|nr:helix-turn-helix domain-containing protein [Nocardiopsis sp. FR26]
MADQIPHGTPSGYSYHGCRCRPCTDAQLRYWNRREYMILTGRWNPHIATEKVRAHILTLRAKGIPDRRIAELADVGATSIYYILHRNGEKTSRRVGEAILSVTHDPDPPPEKKVPAWGTIRRARALAALGWSSGEIAEAAGLTRSVVRHILRGRPRMVLAETATGLVRAYRKLGGGFAPESRTANQVRDEARVKGWPAPAGWDDHWLDLTEDELEAELGREVARMDMAELSRCYKAWRVRGELSPLVVAAAAEYNRRRADQVRAQREAA